MSEATPINSELARRVQDETGQNVYLCYQCVKCTSGCPVAEFFDWQPNQIMRALQLGQEDIALHPQTPWLCASCQTCSTRCPQGLDITAIMEFLTREANARDIKPQVSEVSQQAVAIMKDLYKPLYLLETPFVITSVETAELIKYASNSFLAIKVSFINEIANLCEKVGADVNLVAMGMGLDQR